MPCSAIAAQEHRGGEPEGGDLGQREVDEDDPATDDVKSEVDQDRRQHDERDERPEPECQ